jgi:hypothetical protein
MHLPLRQGYPYIPLGHMTVIRRVERIIRAARGKRVDWGKRLGYKAFMAIIHPARTLTNSVGPQEAS